MAIGDTMYQFILNYHLTTHNLTTAMLTCVVHIPQVSIVCYSYTFYITYACIIMICMGRLKGLLTTHP